MYRNEHAARVVALTQKTASINLDIQKLTLDMQWYDAFDCEHASAQLAQRNRITLDIKQRLNQLSATLQSTSQSKQTCQGVAGGWLSGLWRSTEQKVAQHQLIQIEQQAFDIPAWEKINQRSFPYELAHNGKEVQARYRAVNGTSTEAYFSIASENLLFTEIKKVVSPKPCNCGKPQYVG